jgi:spore cortex formation protein SpoVR/YcgB (stage V sporulation)
MHNKQPLGQDTDEVLKHIHHLWGFDIHLESVTPDNQVTASYHCPPQELLEID